MSDTKSPLAMVDKREEEPVLPGNTSEAKERMTILELRNYGDANHRFIMEQCRWERFEKPQEAGVYHWESWRRCMKKLGVQAMEQFWKDSDPRDSHKSQWAFAKAMRNCEREMVEKRIAVESTSPDRRQRFLAQGLHHEIGKYVYYQGDIAYFISDVQAKIRRRGQLILPGQVDFCIFTNAPKEYAWGLVCQSEETVSNF